jgi:hypothetical protein
MSVVGVPTLQNPWGCRMPLGFKELCRFGCRHYITPGLLNAEGVKELSPGWRLCGTLGIQDYEWAALKERKKTRDHVIALRSIDSSAPSGRRVFSYRYPGFRKASTLG